MFKIRDYRDAYSIMSLNETQRKKKYYKKNGMKIIGRSCYQYLFPFIRLNLGAATDTLRVAFGANSNTYMINHRQRPIVEFLFGIIRFDCIYLTIIEKGISVYEIESATSFVSLIPILKKYLDPIVEYFDAPRNFSEMDIREPCSEMTIHNSRYELIDNMPLYEITSEEIIRMMFIAIDSEYLNIPVDNHVCYD
jgi:hypothetical protein